MMCEPNAHSRLHVAQAEWKKVFEHHRHHQQRQRESDRDDTLSNIHQHRTNTSWGDILREKAKNTFRLYCQNVNGFTLDRRGGQFGELCKVLKEIQADVYCGQEHNLDVQQPHVKSILYESIQQHWHRSRLMAGTTPLDCQSTYKPGGTLILTIANATGRIAHQSSDKWGRWVSQTFQGGGGRRVTIISVYQVVSDVVHPGQITVAAQQHTLLLQTQDKLKSPRAAFRRDLTGYLKECITQGSEIVLAGDFNEVIGSDPDGLVKIMQEANLVDAMTSKHARQLPHTYTRGRNCLDYILVSANLIATITHCGYEPFNIRHPSDHRAYFIDFDTCLLFGTGIQKLSRYEPRMLQSTNVRQVTEYIDYKYDCLLRSNMFERSEQLSTIGNRHQFAERMDRDILTASLAAERHITRFAQPEWSAELKIARDKAQLLQKCISSLRTRIPMPPAIHHQLAILNIAPTTFTSQRLCQIALRQAKTRVQNLISDSYERRDIERNNMVDQLQASNAPRDKARLHAMRAIRKTEKIRQVHKKIKSARTSMQRTGVTRIEIPLHPLSDPKTCTEWKVIDVPSEVLTNLQTRNQRHFGQAHGTPFTIHPLAHDFGYCGDTLSVHELLHGTYDFSQQSDTVKIFLDHLQQTAEMATTHNFPTISARSFQDKLKGWRESTTTSPSGLHLGHHKAMIARHQYTEVSEADTRALRIKRDELNKKQKAIFEVHLALINYALSRGYSFQRWQTVANTMLFKDPGNIKIHRTRVIHIYEADYNLAMGLKWREAMFRADSNNMIHSGQFGSRPFRNSTDPVLIEELQLEMSRITRKTIAQTNYDATSCYDRIIPNLAMIVSQKYGVHPNVTAANARTLEKADYRIRTDLGLAPTGYTHSNQFPIYGTGQGSGNSPAIWCFLSSALYDCYDTQATKAVYCTPSRTHHMEFGMIGFVDDSNGQTNQFLTEETHQTSDEVLRQTQSNAQTWADLLYVSGGALELSKCSYHVLSWAFSAQGDPVLYTDRQRYSPITVTDRQTGTNHELEYLSPYVAHKTLGHYKEPSGNQKEQSRQLQKKSDDVVAFLWKCHLTRSESWIFYYTCYVPSLSYPLTASHFTELQLTKIQRKAMSIIIARCGFNRHTHRAIIYGPSEYGGAGFKRLYDQQGIGQIKAVLRHWRANTPTGFLLRNLVEWVNYSLGMPRCFLEDVHTDFSHMESKWFGSLRQYLKSTDLWIALDSSGIPPLERVHDSYIMDSIIRSKQFTRTQIRRLNYCRLYLNAVMLSDLTTVAGDRLDPDKLRGYTSLFSTHNQWMRINQERPSELEWRLWRKANKIWSDSLGVMTQTLGRWTQPHSKRRIRCMAYQYGTTLAVYNDGHNYTKCHLHTAREYIDDQSGSIHYDDIPEYANPVMVILKTEATWKVTKVTQTIRTPPPLSYGTFAEYIAALHPWEMDLLQHHELSVDPYTACLELQSHFFAGSDGSEKYGVQGAFGWVISTVEGERLALGMGPARGRRMDSYRAECTGSLSILRFLFRIAQYTAAHEPKQGVIGTDSQSLLDKLNPSSSDATQAAVPIKLDELSSEWDLLIEIQEGLRLLPGVSLTYVRGHQDDKRPYDRLPLLAQLNVDADKHAGHYQNQHGTPRPFVPMTARTELTLCIAQGLSRVNTKTR